MQFNDKQGTYILVNKNNIISFNKYWDRDLDIRTTSLSLRLNYTYESVRDEDYNKLKNLIESEDKQ